MKRWVVSWACGNPLNPIERKVVEAQTAFGAVSILASELWGNGPTVALLHVREAFAYEAE